MQYSITSYSRHAVAKRVDFKGHHKKKNYFITVCDGC